ncbi:MAG: hypothetical protein K0Q91_1730 [Fibrobacteria bacterium]|jgi:hypothetical protein|nr:hypothetical protein [Fibrobacteria bacterium]
MHQIRKNEKYFGIFGGIIRRAVLGAKRVTREAKEFSVRHLNFKSVKSVFIASALLSAVAWGQRPYYLVPGLHPGYSLVNMRPAGMENTGANAAPNTGGMAWLPDGKLFIASMSSNAAGGTNANRLGVSHGYILSGIPAATSNATVTVSQVSTGYQMPSGAVVVGSNIYVLDNEDGLTKLTPGAGGTYTKTTLHKGLLGYNTGLTGSGYRSWTGGLAYKDGFFYAVVGMGLIPGGTSEYTDANLYRGKGSVWKISLDGTVADTLAGGVRNPVSMAWGPDSQLFYTDNQGSFMPTSAMFHVKQGGFFGHLKTPFDNQMRTPPAILFPYGSSTSGGTASNPTVARVATDMLTLRSGRFAKQMLVGVNHTTGVNRVFLEKIPTGTPGNYVYQGALFPFSQGFGVGTGANATSEPAIPGVLGDDFTTNVNRMSYGPDGHIYLGGGNSPGNNSGGSHGFVGGRQYGLARLVPNNDTVFEMKAIRSLSATQMEIEFTEPVVSVATTNFTVRQGISTQGTTTAYGGGYAAGTTTLSVTAATLNAAKTKATLTITGMQQRPAVATAGSVEDRTWGSMIQINVTGVAAVSNRPMWGDGSGGGVAWYTLNKFGPGEDVGLSTAIARGDSRDMRSGLLFKMRAGGVAVRSPVEEAWTLRTLDMTGRVVATHNVEAGRYEFVVPTSSMNTGVTILEAKAQGGQRWITAVPKL